MRRNELQVKADALKEKLDATEEREKATGEAPATAEAELSFLYQ